MKVGQALAIIIYKGPSGAESEAIYKYLFESHVKDIPVHLDGSGFDLLISQVGIRKVANYRPNHEDYEIELKGVLQ